MDIVAAAKRIDGVGDLGPVEGVLECAQRAGHRVVTFDIAGMEIPWFGELPARTFRGAFAPLAIMLEARRLFESGAADVVVVRGHDPIRTRFKHDRTALDRVFRVYDGCTFLDGYERVARAFLSRQGLAIDDFKALAAALFENYERTWRRKNPDYVRPDPRWFTFVNELFRGVDCANPYVDFEGYVVLAPRDVAKRLAPASAPRVTVMGVAVEQACPDGIEHAATIATYAHLGEAFERACRDANVDFVARFRRREAMLEVYSCYPVVPLAFLLRSGLCTSLAEAPALLGAYDVTMTGGLNLARAPGNNTTLNALVDAAAALRDDAQPSIAGVHSVGALGYVQAFCVLVASAS